MGLWRWLFGPPVPSFLSDEDDYAQAETVLLSNRTDTIVKVLRLVEETGSKAKRLFPRVEPFLEHEHCRLAAARALWSVCRDPRSPQVVQSIFASSADEEEDSVLAELGLDPATEALLALSFIAKDHPPSELPLVEATKSLLGVLATARGSGDIVNKVFNAFTSGDDNSGARRAAATLAQVAWDHASIKQQLANAVNTPVNEQQKMYAALALGFSAHTDRAKMEEAMSYMNAMFDSPDIATAASRNKIRNDAIAASLALAAAPPERKEKKQQTATPTQGEIPVAVGLMLCDQVIVDKNTQKPSPIGIFTE